MFQTFVTKVATEQPELLIVDGQACLFQCRAHAFALVDVKVGSKAGLYIILTLEKPVTITSMKANMSKHIQQLPTNPKTEWVKPLTRQLQRILKWGDVTATQYDITQACKTGDDDELKAMMPYAEVLIDDGKHTNLPALHDAMRNDHIALQDCEHEFESAFGLPNYKGCCDRGACDSAKGSHCPPYVQCVKCHLHLCVPCRRAVEFEMDARKDEQQDLHEVMGHQWSEHTLEHARCGQCDKYNAYVCPCGTKLCKACFEKMSQHIVKQRSLDETFKTNCLFQATPGCANPLARHCSCSCSQGGAGKDTQNKSPQGANPTGCPPLPRRGGRLDDMVARRP